MMSFARVEDISDILVVCVELEKRCSLTSCTRRARLALSIHCLEPCCCLHRVLSIRADPVMSGAAPPYQSTRNSNTSLPYS